jgi:hypothetical protein
MAKRNLINIIGKLFVDDKFREKYFEDRDAAREKLTGLTANEKKFLKDKEMDIRRWADTLDVKYKGVNKTRK